MGTRVCLCGPANRKGNTGSIRNKTYVTGLFKSLSFHNFSFFFFFCLTIAILLFYVTWCKFSKTGMLKKMKIIISTLELYNYRMTTISQHQSNPKLNWNLFHIAKPSNASSDGFKMYFTLITKASSVLYFSVCQTKPKNPTSLQSTYIRLKHGFFRHLPSWFF